MFKSYCVEWRMKDVSEAPDKIKKTVNFHIVDDKKSCWTGNKT